MDAAGCSDLAEFVIYPDPRLSLKAHHRTVDTAMLATGERLRAAVENVQAYGLAGAHIGEIEPVIVISVAADTSQRDYRVLFNPSVLAVGQQTAAGAEGSVSMPGIEVPIERPEWAEIGYNDATGVHQTARYEGFIARCALHEIEQIEGVFFLSRLSRLKRDTAIRKFQKLNRAG